LGLVPNLGNHLVLVWFWFLWQSFSWFCFVLTEPKNHLSKILQILYHFFPKNIKIRYKNTFNQIIVKIPQNFIFKNNNIIFCHFDNIS
jgi:hypothetical protein